MRDNNKQFARAISPWLTRCVIALVTTTCMVATAQDWELVWSDEFDGPNIDLTKWSHEVNGDGGGNNELQYYTARSENSFIENGHLVIQALEENYGGKQYTSARLRTLNKGDWKYGRFEIRARTPTGQGLWPAIWMLPTDWVYGGWAASGEIDIMELLGQQDNRVYGTLHYGGQWPNNTHSGDDYYAPSGDFNSSFHTFALEWEENEFRWYVDGVHYLTQNSWYSEAGAYPAPFNQRFHMLLNVAVGGDWPGSPNASTVFPQRMEVDYVRVYSTTNIPTPSTSTPYYGTAMAIPGTIEAEDYDNGGPGTAYADTDSSNNGSSYRLSEWVDIEACTDTGGGYNIGWTAAGEWLKYTVDVAPAGEYTITTRVASDSGGGAFHIEVDDVDVTGSISVGATGGWQSWIDKTSSVTLGSGEQVVKLVIEDGGMNINLMEFVLDQEHVNSAPVFVVDPILTPYAVQDSVFDFTLVGLATDADAGDTLTYAKVPDSGPAWLNVTTNGALLGTPGNANVGSNSWTVQVYDGHGGIDTATLKISVLNVNDAPEFTIDPIIMPNGYEGSGYTGSIAGSATDVDAGDTLTYSKFSGPLWLNVATNGTLSGTPTVWDVGQTNTWTVWVSDSNGSIDSAKLKIFVDNELAPPVLSIQLSGSNLEILWPSTTTGFSLYNSTNLMPPAVWSSVTNTPIIQGDDWMVVMPISGAPQYFRLVKP